jgi:hypothetical protein
MDRRDEGSCGQDPVGNGRFAAIEVKGILKANKSEKTSRLIYPKATILA